MLSAIKDIGELASITETQRDGKVLTILLDIDKQAYSGIEIEDFDSGKIIQYLYKEGASKGNVPSPFCPITEPQKTYKKIEGWLKQCSNVDDDALKADISFITKVFETIKVNREAIIADIAQKIQDLPKKKGEGRFLTCKINGKYLGEYEIFRKAIEYFDYKKFEGSSSENKICSICGTAKGKVGKIDIFKFSSTDKPGFIMGGFDDSLAWRNFPVCMECKTALENGRKFLESNLNFRFVYGLNYLLIPRPLIGSQRELGEMLNILSDTTKAVGLKERIKKRITNDEDEILEYLAEEKDVLTLNFLFLQKQNSAERILLLIEDVFPSRIRKIFDAKDYVDKVFDNDSDKGFTFGTIRTFFSKSDENKKVNNLNKYFLEIVDSVFKGRKLDFSFLLKFYMAVIRRGLIKSKDKDWDFKNSIRDALTNTIFFENLGLINFEEEDMEESIFEDVFKKYGNTFAVPVRRGIFLTGALTQMLLNKQGKERGAKPFMKKLKGLKMDEQDIKALLPAVQNKFEEYNSFGKGKKLVAEEAYNYLFSSGDNWRLSVDEINFYFAGGMNLVRKIKDIIYAKGEKDADMEEDDQSNETNE